VSEVVWEYRCVYGGTLGLARSDPVMVHPMFIIEPDRWGMSLLAGFPADRRTAPLSLTFRQTAGYRYRIHFPLPTRSLQLFHLEASIEYRFDSHL
jgi:hypothetical protein